MNYRENWKSQSLGYEGERSIRKMEKKKSSSISESSCWLTKANRDEIVRLWEKNS